MADNNETSRLYIFTTILAIMFGMMVLDAYIVEQNSGSRRTGVIVMLLIGDVCFLFILRYVGVWAGMEVRSTKRGCSMAEWFFLIFVVDIKTYFILDNVRKGCFEAVEMAVSSQTDQKADQSEFISIFQPELTFTGRENMTTEELMLAYAQISVRSKYDSVLTACDYSIKMKKILTFFQALFIPGFYLLLLGADYLESVSSLRELDEIKMRAFWVVVDLLDLLDLQSSMWESKQGEIPYLAVGFIYFYCYIVLIVLPPVSLAEMSRKNEPRSHEMQIYLVASFVTVNVATTMIRLVLLINNNFSGVSTVFIAKNVICIFLKATTLLQLHFIRKGKTRFARGHASLFTLNELRENDRNHGMFSEFSVDGGKSGEAQIRSDGSTAIGADGRLRRIRPVEKFSGKNQLLNPWSTEMQTEKGAEEMVSNNAKRCNALVTKMGGNESHTILSHKTEVYSSPNKWSRWGTAGTGRLEFSRKLAGDYKSMEEILSRNLSPKNSSNLLSRKMSRSISATLDACSEGSIEKRVRFRKENLSPIASEDRITCSETMRQKAADSSFVVLLPNMPPSDSTVPFPSNSSLSTADCGSTMESIRRWNSNVIDQINVVRSTFNRGNTERVALSPEPLERLFTTTAHQQPVNIETEGKYSSRLPSPLLDSLPRATVDNDELFQMANSEYESSGSLHSDSLSPFSPVASAITSSPSIKSSAATSSASVSGILPPPMDVATNRFRHYEPKCLIGSGGVGLLNGSESLSESGTAIIASCSVFGEEQYDNIRKPLTYQNSVDSGHLSDTMTLLKRIAPNRPKMVNAESQTNVSQITTI